MFSYQCNKYFNLKKQKKRHPFNFRLGLSIAKNRNRFKIGELYETGFNSNECNNFSKFVEKCYEMKRDIGETEMAMVLNLM